MSAHFYLLKAMSNESIDIFFLQKALYFLFLVSALQIYFLSYRIMHKMQEIPSSCNP